MPGSKQLEPGTFFAREVNLTGPWQPKSSVRRCGGGIRIGMEEKAEKTDYTDLKDIAVSL